MSATQAYPSQALKLACHSEQIVLKSTAFFRACIQQITTEGNKTDLFNKLTGEYSTNQ